MVVSNIRRLIFFFIHYSITSLSFSLSISPSRYTFCGFSFVLCCSLLVSIRYSIFIQRRLCLSRNSKRFCLKIICGHKKTPTRFNWKLLSITFFVSPQCSRENHSIAREQRQIEWFWRKTLNSHILQPIFLKKKNDWKRKLISITRTFQPVYRLSNSNSKIIYPKCVWIFGECVFSLKSALQNCLRYSISG